MGRPAKQFRTLGGRPAMCWAARPLLAALDGPLAVVLPEEWMEEGERLLRDHLGAGAGRVTVIAGGARRQDSVRAGLAAVAGAGTILVHDASRPFCSTDLVARIASRAAEGTAVVPAIPIHDTLKEIDGPAVLRTHDRRCFVAAQTPQGFPAGILRRAHAEGGDFDASDDAALCERAGMAVAWIPGEPLNRKLTDAGDWAWAEEVVAAGRVAWR